MVSVEGALAFLGLGPGGDDHDAVPLDDMSYADDLVFVLDVVLEEVLQVARQAGCIIWQVYEECWFRVNFWSGENSGGDQMGGATFEVLPHDVGA